MWWIPQDNPHMPNLKWWCSACHKVRPVELNPQWIKDELPYRGEGGCPYKWFARCKTCHKQHYQQGGFECPTCGWDETDAGDYIEYDNDGKVCKLQKPLLRIGQPEYNHGKAMEFGGNPVDWEEEWECPKCGTVFINTNSNC